MIRSAVHSMGVRRGGSSPVVPFNFDSISDLIIHLRAEDVAPGAFNTWMDRKYSYLFSGNATADTSINGTPTVSFSGAAGQYLTTGVVNIGQINGLSALTVFTCHKVITRVDADWNIVLCSGDYGMVNGNYRINHNKAGNKYTPYIQTATGGTYCDVAEPSAGPHIYTNQMTPQTISVRIDGAEPAHTNVDNVTALTFANSRLSIGNFYDQSVPWSLAITAIIIYGRALSLPEIVSVENGIAALSGITL